MTKKIDMSSWFPDLELVQCPKCGAWSQPNQHATESCEMAQKFNAMKRSLMAADLWESDDELAVRRHIKAFEREWEDSRS